MKRMLFNLLLLLLLCPAAMAQDDPLENIILQDGWLTGTVTAHFHAGEENQTIRVLKIDCPEPPSPYPDEILTVTKGYVSKKQMQRALKAAGQRTEGRFQNSRGSALYTGDWSVEASADLSKEDAAEQAVNIALRYFNALGVQVVRTPVAVERPYDYDAYMEQQLLHYSHIFSDTSTFIESAQANWKRRAKYNPKQMEYTQVQFDLMLNGMRLWRQPSYSAGYADEPGAIEGRSVSAYAIVSDSGVLVEAACDLLELQSSRPTKESEFERFTVPPYSRLLSPLIPAADWQSALRIALEDMGRTGLILYNTEDRPYQNKGMDKPITVYASQSVITGIFPCLSMISRDEWIPLWYIECKQEYTDGWRN